MAARFQGQWNSLELRGSPSVPALCVFQKHKALGSDCSQFFMTFFSTHHRQLAFGDFSINSILKSSLMERPFYTKELEFLNPLETV